MRIRGTPTDSLADIIQSLQLIRKSGSLTIEREVPGGFSELGTIVFHDGQVVAADVGRIKGAEAFRKLATWQSCHFVFEALNNNTSPSSLASPGSSIVGQDSSALGRRHKETSLNEHASTSIVPYRSQLLQSMIPDFQRFGLSRHHRQLFLLIDGKRTCNELARLLGRNPQETLTLLADLGRMNFISY